MSYNYDDHHHAMMNLCYQKGQHEDEKPTEQEAKYDWLAENLPWLSPNELDRTCLRPCFPGFSANYGDLSLFVATVKKSAMKLVPCKMTLSGFTLIVSMDVVTGDVYIGSNGNPVLSDVSGFAQFTFGVKTARKTVASYPRRDSVFTTDLDVRNGRACLMPAINVKNAIFAAGCATNSEGSPLR